MAEWSAGFAAFTGRFAGRFTRVESRRQMAVYLRGLLSETERKNGWTLAEAAGDSGPQGMQRLLNFYAWDADGSVTMCVRWWRRRWVTPSRVC